LLLNAKYTTLRYTIGLDLSSQRRRRMGIKPHFFLEPRQKGLMEQRITVATQKLVIKY